MKSDQLSNDPLISSTLSATIEIKIGDAHVTCSATENFIVSHLPDFVEKIAAKLVQFKGFNSTSNLSAEAQPISQSVPAVVQERGRIEITTSTIAAALNVTSGGDLIMAACAQLTFIQNREILHRRDILEEMRSANAYFRRTYTNNFSSYLATLVREGKLIERNADTYSLSANVRDEILLKLPK